MQPTISTTVLQEAAQTAGAARQESGEVRRDLAAQGGDGVWIMPFGPDR